MKQIKFLNSLPFLHMASMDSYCYGEILCQPHGIMQTQLDPRHPASPVAQYITARDAGPKGCSGPKNILHFISTHTPSRHWFLAASAPEQMTTFPTCSSQEETPTTSQGT